MITPNRARLTSRARHGGDTAEFGQLSWKEQASSITATILQVERAVKAHVARATREGRDASAARRKCISQVMRMLIRLI